MSANVGQRSRKLFFDVSLTATRVSQAFLCTQFTVGTPGDRHGNLLQVLQACTGSTNQTIQRSRDVSAWFQPSVVPTVALGFQVQFVKPTANGNNLGVTMLPYLTVGGGSVAVKAGQTPIFGTAGAPRHFSVWIAKNKVITAVVTGVLHVQRNHSIEV